VARWLLLAYLLVPAALTLSADSPSAALNDFYELADRVVDLVTQGRVDLSINDAEALANVALFVPIGLLLRPSLLRAPLSGLLLVAALGSLAIEVVQYALLPDRIPSLIDVLLNAAGAAVGLVLADDVQRLARHLRSRRRR
jgi:glycopeptide antibiotics resistance protein